MKSKKIQLLAIAVAMLLLFPGIIFAINIDLYPYYKDIVLEDNYDEPVLIGLDADVLNSMNLNGNDLRITENNIEVPCKLILKKIEELAHDSDIIEVSSTRPDFRGISFDVDNIIDGDYSTDEESSFQIDYAKDPEHAWMIIDFKNKKLTNKIQIWSEDDAFTWTHIKIEGSNTQDNWVNVKAKTQYPFSAVISILYPASNFRYLKITLWHTQSLKIGEIEIYGASGGDIIFYAKPSKNYRLYYGNKYADKPIYDTSSLYTSSHTPLVDLSAQKNNPSFSSDIDGDGILVDNCPFTSNPDQADLDKDGVGNACDNCISASNVNQQDADNDGVGDACDNCPYNSNSDQMDKDIDGIGYTCDDADNDRIINSKDNCVDGYNPSQKDSDNDGIGDACIDLDNDGIISYKDNCLSISNPDQKDSDNDKIGDVCDNCLFGYNPDQTDIDDDGIGDICEDDDKDNIVNHLDNCKNISNPDQKDRDGDTIGDACDNCINTKNKDQIDENNNGIGDVCDDIDADGIINPLDNCPTLANPNQKDQNNNGIGDLCEDYDNDLIWNGKDNCIRTYNPTQQDSDNDGIGDACDEKDDRLTENKSVVWMAIILSVLLISFFAFRLYKKTDSSKNLSD